MKAAQPDFAEAQIMLVKAHNEEYWINACTGALCITSKPTDHAVVTYDEILGEATKLLTYSD